MRVDVRDSDYVVIYKYLLDLSKGDLVELDIPGEPVSAAFDDADKAWLWAVAHPESPDTHWRVLARGTGHPLPAGNWRHLSTQPFHHGYFVWHFFVEGPTERGEVE